MPECELCGRTYKARPSEVKIEGVMMEVCPNCARLGKPVQRKTSRATVSPSKTASSPRATRSSAPTRSSKVRRSPPRSNEKDLRSDYGEVIREARRSRKLTQQQLAAQLNEAVSLIQNIETQKMRPTDRLVKKLERFLDIQLMESIADIHEAATANFDMAPATTLGDLVKIKKKSKK